MKPASHSNPIHETALRSQAGFRILMQAFAHPGTLFTSQSPARSAPAIGDAAASVLLTLCDFETPVHLARSMAAIDGLADWLRFETTAPITDEPARAMFALVDLRTDPFSLQDFAQGTEAYPDRATTVIFLCDALEGGVSLSLSGPGIKATRWFHPKPWPETLGQQWLINRQRFPLGVDLIFCAGNTLAALPRTTRILEEVL
jgi:alpha-D-ribose 1-methylphosphonate 5-triphosphate synthase subunit PhnH